ncbi:MAG: endonuclease domain-containing protein [Phycisphaerales bacterium]
MIERAQGLRKRMTFPERLLWSKLRHESIGARFRRQSNIGACVVDFCCHERKVIVELDGRTHRGEKGRDDAERDTWLARDGWRVVRVADDDVLRDVDAVVAFVRRACESEG